MIKRSIATVSLSGALDEKLRAIASAGFEAVEIFENDLLSFGAGPRDIAKLCRDLNLEICAFQPFRDFEGMPEPQRARNFARAERKFDLMQELGTDLLLICSNVSSHSLGGIDRAADDFRELGDRAAKRGLPLNESRSLSKISTPVKPAAAIASSFSASPPLSETVAMEVCMAGSWIRREGSRAR